MSVGHFMAFTRDELRDLARIHGIKRGQNKIDTAKNLINGTPEDGSPQGVTFPVRIEIPIDKE